MGTRKGNPSSSFYTFTIGDRMDLFRCVIALVVWAVAWGMLVPPAAGQNIDRSKLVDLT